MAMGMPNSPQTLTPEQIAELNAKLSAMRHNINNNLSLFMAALELLKYKPELRDKMLGTLAEQPPKIIQELTRFSLEFEQQFGITRSDKSKS